MNEQNTAIDLIGQFSSSLITDNVGIIEFAESDQYCNRPLYPRQRTLMKIIFNEELDGYDEDVLTSWIRGDNDVMMAPKMRERMQYIRDNGYDHFRTVQLVGGRRSSKGHLTGLAVAYKVFLATQIDDPMSYFKIARGKDIHFAVLAGKLEQAKATQYSDVFDWVIECKPLQERRLISKALAESISIYTPADLRRLSSLRLAGGRIDKDMASLKVQALGVNPGTLRGIASLVAVFDEYAHILSGEYKQADAALWTALIPSLRQFKRKALIFANSSPYNKQGQFFKLYEDSLALDPNGFPVLPDHFMFQFPSWELYRDYEKDKHFVSIGAVVEPPETDPDLAREERQDPEKFKVEYRAQFAEVTNAFLMPDMVDRMFDPAFNVQVIGRDLKPEKGAQGFVRYKGHGDPATVSANFGLAIGHVEEVTNKENGMVEQHVVFDVINAFFPDDFENHTIDYLQVTPALIEMINAFRPFEFTFDQYESTYLIQSLTKEAARKGIPCDIYETTATRALNEQRARNFKTALNLGRVHAPAADTYKGGTTNPIELAQWELKFLQETNGKVDKQSVGPVKTKDIADAMMAVVDTLIGDSLYEAPSYELRLGAQGGYAIGKESTTPSELQDWYPKQKGREYQGRREQGYRVPNIFSGR